MIDMKVSLQSKNLWVQSNIQNVAFCQEANIVSGDGVSIFLPLSMLAATSEFIRSLLIPCCNSNSCGGVVRISLPSVTGETLVLASQILLSGETENIETDNIDDISTSVEELMLVLLGFKVQLGINLYRRAADQDSPMGCVEDEGPVDIVNKSVRFLDKALNGPEKTNDDDMNNNYENPNLVLKKKVKMMNKAADPIPQTKVDDISPRLRRKSCSSSFSSSCSSSSKNPSLSPSLSRYMLRERSTKEKSSTISTQPNSVVCGGTNAMEDISKASKVVSDNVKKRNPSENVKTKSCVKSHPDISQTSAYFQCQDCDESYRFKVSLIKHQVEEHFYEELENMFVEEFFRCSVCCKLDFSNTGLGMFIRHKAESHQAIEMLQAMISMTDTDDKS